MYFNGLDDIKLFHGSRNLVINPLATKSPPSVKWILEFFINVLKISVLSPGPY